MTVQDALLRLFVQMSPAERLELLEYAAWLRGQQEAAAREPISLAAYRPRAEA
jgi:hypothetical protein